MSFDTLVDYFEQRRDDLVKDHHNEYVVIHNCEIIKFFDEYDEAYLFADKNFEQETYLVGQCITREENRAVFRSRVK